MKTGFLEVSPGNFSAMRLCVLILANMVCLILLLQAIGHIFIDRAIMIDWVRAGAFIVGVLGCKAFQTYAEKSNTAS
jgi:hypothetical protein